MIALTMLSPLVVQADSSQGLNLGRLIHHVPTDPASIFTMVLLFGAIGLVFWSGRSRDGDKEV